VLFIDEVEAVEAKARLREGRTPFTKEIVTEMLEQMGAPPNPIIGDVAGRDQDEAQNRSGDFDRLTARLKSLAPTRRRGASFWAAQSLNAHSTRHRLVGGEGSDYIAKRLRAKSGPAICVLVTDRTWSVPWPRANSPEDVRLNPGTCCSKKRCPKGKGSIRGDSPTYGERFVSSLR